MADKAGPGPFGEPGRNGVRQRLEDAKEAIADKAADFVESSAEYLGTRDWQEVRQDLERQIRSNPLASVGVAFGAGFLLAQAFGNRRGRGPYGESRGRPSRRSQTLAPIRRALISGATALLARQLQERVLADSND